MKIGKLYEVKFRDHFISGEEGEDLTCEAVGWLMEENEAYIKLAYWRCHSSVGDSKLEKNGAETFCVLKNAILKKRLVGR